MPISKLQLKSWLEVLLTSQDQNFTWGFSRDNLLGMDILAGDPNTAKNFHTIQVINQLNITCLMALSMASCAEVKVYSLYCSPSRGHQVNRMDSIFNKKNLCEAHFRKDAWLVVLHRFSIFWTIVTFLLQV